MPLTETRTKAFQRNVLLESLLSELNADLQPSERRLVNKYSAAEMPFPVILVMGPLRSGTTLFTQWFANSGVVSYPSNLLSRFYHAPIIGAKIQLLLTDTRFNFRNELGEFSHQSDYRSENGKTQGVLAPNEFWYFWRQFLADPSCDIWSDQELKQTMDINTMRAELAGVMDIFQKPFLTKGMLFNYNIPFLDSIFEKVLFVQIKRDPVANVSSVLDARRRQLGSEQEWYSFKIAEYNTLIDLPPIEQAAGQVHFINQAIERGLRGVHESRKITINYEEFCAAPSDTFSQLTGKLGLANASYNGPDSFSATRSEITHDRDAIQRALHTFSKHHV